MFGVDVGGEDLHVERRRRRAAATAWSARSSRAPGRSSRRPTRCARVPPRARRVAAAAAATLVLQVLEVVRLAEEAGDVGGQRRQHLLALVDRAVGGERARSSRGSSPGRARAGAWPGANRPASPWPRAGRCRRRRARIAAICRKSAAVKRELAVDEAPGVAAWRALVRASCGSPASGSGSTRSRAIRLIMRPSMASRPRTKVFAVSEATSGVGCITVVGDGQDVARPRRPAGRRPGSPIWATMMTWRAVGSARLEARAARPGRRSAAPRRAG